jgi:CubicO group peptidase (beta-lactamase class C family)
MWFNKCHPISDSTELIKLFKGFPLKSFFRHQPIFPFINKQSGFSKPELRFVSKFKHMKFRKTITLIFSFLIIIQISSAQVTEKQVDELMDKAMKTFNVAGAAVGIMKDGEVVLTKGYGVQSVDTQKPVTKHTNFEIASNSKAFTTAALTILVEQGKLDWNDRVVKHIPEFTMYDEYVKEHFTITDLVTHRSGMNLGAGDLMWFPDGADFKIDDLLQSFQHQDQVSEFRTKYDYNNLLFIVAGEVIERVSGMTWKEFVTENILTPLDMKNTYTSISQIKDTKTLASPHAQKKDGTPYTIPNNTHPMNGAAAAMLSNVNDLTKWMQMHLNDGKYGKKLENTLFSEKSHQKMWSLHTPANRRSARYNTHFSGYGLGWFLADVKGNKAVYHTGGMPGMLSKTLMIPDLDLGIVILTNTSEGGAGLFNAVANSLQDLYLGLDDGQWIDKYDAYFKKSAAESDSIEQAVWTKANQTDQNSVDFGEYEGLFEDGWFGGLKVHVKDGKWWLTSLRSPQMNGQLFYYGASTFLVKWEYTYMTCDAYIIFNLDENGKAQSFKVKEISPATDFSFDFEDLKPKRVE